MLITFMSEKELYYIYISKKVQNQSQLVYVQCTAKKIVQNVNESMHFLVDRYF